MESYNSSNTSSSSTPKKAFKTKHHQHDLMYLNSQEKDYTTGNWYCDICNKHFGLNVKSMHCKPCGWDICDSCFFADFQYLE